MRLHFPYQGGIEFLDFNQISILISYSKLEKQTNRGGGKLLAEGAEWGKKLGILKSLSKVGCCFI